MHMADALVSPAVAGVLYGCSAVAAGVSIKNFHKEEGEALKVPLMGIMGAFVFAAQMINFTIPGTGSSGHLCGSVLLLALLGPYAAFITMIGILLIQCLLFADGGLLALGCNIWNMAFYGCFICSFLIWRPITAKGLSRNRIIYASVLGSVIGLQLGAFSVTVETLASGITELPFAAFLSFMLPIHLAIGLVEGLITAAVLVFVYEAHPELLWKGQGFQAYVPAPIQSGMEGRNVKKGRMSPAAVIAVLGVAAALIGGLLSLIASGLPDGLEWSIEKFTGFSETEALGAVHSAAAEIQNASAFLPDYAFPGSESPLGTSFSGIAGSFAVVLFCFLVCFVLRKLRTKSKA